MPPMSWGAEVGESGAVLPACLPGGSQSATSHCEVAQELDWHGPWLANVFRWVPVTAVAGHCREWCVCLVLNL